MRETKGGILLKLYDGDNKVITCGNKKTTPTNSMIRGIRISVSRGIVNPLPLIIEVKKMEKELKENEKNE